MSACSWMVHINTISDALGKDRSMALPIFHCFTCCDTTSGFFGRGKRSAWEAWKSYPDVTKAFLHIATHPYAPLTMKCEHFKLLEHYCVILYDKNSSLDSINDAQRELFCQRNNSYSPNTGCPSTTLKACYLPLSNLGFG